MEVLSEDFLWNDAQFSTAVVPAVTGSDQKSAKGSSLLLVVVLHGEWFQLKEVNRRMKLQLEEQQETVVNPLVEEND